jgi:hypothetical protein
MLVATHSSLSLSVAFDDGSVRDFSADARVAYAMAPGSTLCQVEPGACGCETICCGWVGQVTLTPVCTHAINVLHPINQPTAPGGGFQVVASAPASSSVSGSCTITATASFGGSAPPLTATTSVSLVGLSQLAVVALGPGVAAVPALPPGGGTVLGDELVLLKCDATNYDQVGCGCVAQHGEMRGRWLGLTHARPPACAPVLCSARCGRLAC